MITSLDGHEGSAPSIPAWKVLAHGHKACISQHLCPGNGIPCWNCTSLCGFANRRLLWSANGIIGSNFDDQRRIKIFAELIWVAPLIRQYAG